MTDAELWAIAQAGYEASWRVKLTPWDEETPAHRYCWFLGAQHLTSGTATVQSLRQAIQPGLYLKSWDRLTVAEILIYRAIYGAMLSTAQRIAARTRVAA